MNRLLLFVLTNSCFLSINSSFFNITFNSSDIAAFESYEIEVTPIKPRRPTFIPTSYPSRTVSTIPTLTKSQSKFTFVPTKKVTAFPSCKPTKLPIAKSSVLPTNKPSEKPRSSCPTFSLSNFPSVLPTKGRNSVVPSRRPTTKPSSMKPSFRSTKIPSVSPSKSMFPSISKIVSNSKPSLSSTALPTSLIPTVTPKTRRPSLKATTVSPSTRLPSRVPTTAKPTVLSVTNDITYHGGTLMVGPVNLYNIYFGDFSSPAQTRTRAVLDYFANNLGASPLYATVTGYYQNINGNVTYASNSVRLVKAIPVRRNQRALKVSRGDFLTIIAEALNSVRLPIDNNGIYAVIFRGDFIVDGFLTEWCGYHGVFPLPNTDIILKFFVVGDPETATNGLGFNCEQFTNNTINNSIGGDSLANIYAHEVAETVTNSDRGWYFDRSNTCPPVTCAGLENEDLCNWDFQTDQNSNMLIGEKPYLIQSFWQRGYGCVLAAI